MKTGDIAENLKKMVMNRRKDSDLGEISDLLRKLLIGYQVDSYTVAPPFHDKGGNRLGILSTSIANGSDSETVIFYDPLCREIASSMDGKYKFEVGFPKWSEEYMKILNPKRRKRIKKKSSLI